MGLERGKNHKSKIGGLVKRDLRGRYKGSLLGFLWNFLNPLCQIVVYIIIFSYVFRSGIEYYAVYLIIGMMPWNFFADSLKEGAGCIVNQADMTSISLGKNIFFVISTVDRKSVV